MSHGNDFASMSYNLLTFPHDLLNTLQRIFNKLLTDAFDKKKNYITCSSPTGSISSIHIILFI